MESEEPPNWYERELPGFRRVIRRGSAGFNAAS